MVAITRSQRTAQQLQYRSVTHRGWPIKVPVQNRRKVVIMGRKDQNIEATEDEFAEVESVEDEVETDEPETAKKPAEKAKKEPARGDLPEGYVTPVGFAKIATERGLHTSRTGDHTVAPQMVYSYIKNAPKDDQFPLETITDSLGHERSVVSIEAGAAWWERKNARTAERAANAKAKADKKAAKAAAAANETETDEVEDEVAEVE